MGIYSVFTLLLERLRSSLRLISKKKKEWQFLGFTFYHSSKWALGINGRWKSVRYISTTPYFSFPSASASRRISVMNLQMALADDRGFFFFSLRYLSPPHCAPRSGITVTNAGIKGKDNIPAARCKSPFTHY